MNTSRSQRTEGSSGELSLEATASLLERLGKEACDNRDSLATLLEVARPRLVHLIRVRMPAQLAGRLDADDIVQETLVVAAQRFDDYRTAARVPAFVWLRGLAVERLIDATRRHLGAEKRAVSREVANRRWLDQSTAELICHWAVDSSSPSRAVIRGQQADDLQRALESLPDNYRDVLVLRFFESMTLAETAATLDCSVANAKVLQFRALQRLQKIMIDTIGWTSEDRRLD